MRVHRLLEAGDRCEGRYDGSWLNGPRCPTAGRVGRCESLSGDGMPLQSIVSYQPLTTIEAQSACVDGGTFYEE